MRNDAFSIFKFVRMKSWARGGQTRVRMATTRRAGDHSPVISRLQSVSNILRSSPRGIRRSDRYQWKRKTMECSRSTGKVPAKVESLPTATNIADKGHGLPADMQQDLQRDKAIETDALLGPDREHTPWQDEDSPGLGKHEKQALRQQLMDCSCPRVSHVALFLTFAGIMISLCHLDIAIHQEEIESSAAQLHAKAADSVVPPPPLQQNRKLLPWWTCSEIREQAGFAHYVLQKQQSHSLHTKNGMQAQATDSFQHTALLENLENATIPERSWADFVEVLQNITEKLNQRHADTARAYQTSSSNRDAMRAFGDSIVRLVVQQQQLEQSLKAMQSMQQTSIRLQQKADSDSILLGIAQLQEQEREVLKAINRLGRESDRQIQNSGQNSQLSAAREDEILSILRRNAEDGGLSNGNKASKDEKGEHILDHEGDTREVENNATRRSEGFVDVDNATDGDQAHHGSNISDEGIILTLENILDLVRYERAHPSAQEVC